MTFSRPRLLRSLRALVLGLTVLCLLVQPLLGAAHELHEVEHAMIEEAPETSATAETAAPGSLDAFLHAFDCCLHATAVSASLTAWLPMVLGSPPPRTESAEPAGSPSSRFLRPPIAA